MIEEDQTTPRCTTSSGNNSNICRSSKKERPRKLPQRGLGVAQLEKMRLEEQQKKDSAYLIAAADVSVSSSSVRPPFSAVCNGNTGGVPLTGVNGHKSWGLMPYETEPLCPLPRLMQRGQQPSFSMVNLSSRTSSTSVMNFQMELPSNQSYYKNFKPLLPEEDKVIGMKRPYPFSLDNVPGPLFPTKCYPPIVHSINGQVEATLISKSTTSDISSFREGPPCSTSNGVFARDFLTLAPPTTPMCSTSKSKQSLSNSFPCELPDLDSLAYHQGSFEDSIMTQGGVGLNLQRPYYSFFPPAQIERPSAVTMANCKSGEVDGHVDLNLKL